MSAALLKSPALTAGATIDHREVLGLIASCPGLSDLGRPFLHGMWSTTLAHLDEALVRDPDYEYDHHADPVKLPSVWTAECVRKAGEAGCVWLSERTAALQVVGVPPAVVAGFLGVCYARARCGQHQEVSLEWLGAEGVWEDLLYLDWWPFCVSVDGSTIGWEPDA